MSETEIAPVKSVKAKTITECERSSPVGVCAFNDIATECERSETVMYERSETITECERIECKRSESSMSVKAV